MYTCRSFGCMVFPFLHFNFFFFIFFFFSFSIFFLLYVLIHVSSIESSSAKYTTIQNAMRFQSCCSHSLFLSQLNRVFSLKQFFSSFVVVLFVSFWSRLVFLELTRLLAHSLCAACIHGHFSSIQCARLSLYAYALTHKFTFNQLHRQMYEWVSRHKALVTVNQYYTIWRLVFSLHFHQHASILIRTIWIFNAYNFCSFFAFNLQFIQCAWDRKLLEKYWFCFMNEREPSSWLNQYKSCECVTMVLALCRHESLTKIIVHRVNVIISRHEKKSPDHQAHIRTDGLTKIIRNFSICVLNMNRLPFVSFWYGDLQKRSE